MGDVGLHAERTIWPGSVGVALALTVSLLACAARAEPPSAAEPHGPSSRSSWPAAQARGISRTVFERATADFQPDPEVIALATFQPEHTKPAGDYVRSIARQARIDSRTTARCQACPARSSASRPPMASIATSCLPSGVSRSAYGTEMGSRNVVRSLATLAVADARRAPFWTRELIAALRILQDGAVRPEKLVGSWAGAVGHTQFIPSTYNARAVDFDKDGRRDIWETVADALASIRQLLAGLRLGHWQPMGFRGRATGSNSTLPGRRPVAAGPLPSGRPRG